jgi:hypothetical protein
VDQLQNWYQQLTLQFSDGTVEVLYLDMSRSGRHRPRPNLMPAEWTKLAFQKCPCCTLASGDYCPAALSLEETLLTLRERKSFELVTATAMDPEERTTSVKWPLQKVGAAFVQIAVFCSGCPVGSRFRPLVRDLRPFATGRELSKHLVYKHLLQHKADAAASAAAVTEALKPLQEVFTGLFKRLQTVPLEAAQDAIPNSIVLMHSVTMHLGAMVGKLIEEILGELA